MSNSVEDHVTTPDNQVLLKVREEGASYSHKSGQTSSRVALVSLALQLSRALEPPHCSGVFDLATGIDDG
jgi:hypothetical protein